MASQTCDVTKIQDEDVLRRMWQETDDFSKKKEIRAHMYKVREQRLKEFYTTGEVARDIQTTSTITTKNTSSKNAQNTHHADSLMDHSFQSLKSKEIRDSASPTKDLAFSQSTVHSDRGWNVRETKECSNDGKTQTVTNVATNSGAHDIPGGVANYAAKNEAKMSVYQDGDDQNYVKAVGTSNTSVLKQEAHGVDGNTSFKSTSSSSSTTSRYGSEQRASTTKGYVPESVLKDPNTKVYTETKTLPDGTKVTTTRYETTGSCSKTSGTQSSNTIVKNTSSSTQRRDSHQSDSQRREVQLRENNQRQTMQDTEQTQRLQNVKQEHQHHVQENKCLQNVHKEQHIKNANVEHVHETNKNIQRVQDTRNEQRVQRQDNVENIQKSCVNVHKDHHTERHVHDTENRRVDQQNINVVRKIDDRVVREKSVPKMESVQTMTTTTATNKAVAKPTDQIIDSGCTTTVKTVVERDSSAKDINTNISEKVHTERHTTTTHSTTSNTIDKNRVSVDISATHDAFARSLRSVTPERDRRTQSFRTPSPDKKYKITKEKRGSQQYASNETITKLVHNESDRRSTSPREKPVCGKPNDKVLRRTDTYEERVRQILGITERRKSKPDKDVSDILASDRHANRKPSVTDVPRRPSKSPEKKIQEYPAQKRGSPVQLTRKSSMKSPEKDIAPQTNWLPSAPRQSPEKKSPERRTPDRVTFSPGKTHATATAKEIRKYHGGKRTCSPAIDLEIVTPSDIDRKSVSPDRDEMLPRVFTTSKNGQTYSVDFIHVEKEVTHQLASDIDRSSPSRSSPRSDFDRSSPSRSSPRSSIPRAKSPKKDTAETVQTEIVITEEFVDTKDTDTYTTTQTTEDELMKANVKHLKGKDDEEVITDRRSKSQSPTRFIEEEIIVEEKETAKAKTVKKDLSRDEMKKQKVSETVTTTTTGTPGKKAPVKKNSSTNVVTQVINLDTTPNTSRGKPSKPKQRPDEQAKCISTKSIIINEAVAQQHEIIVDLKRSKSSREDSPDRVWPVQTEEDSGIPRYPDQVQEPEDSRRVKTNVNDIIIDEDEHIEEFNRITELVDTEITDVDRVAETDECLLTVNEKVNKFQHSKDKSKKTKGPAPKVSRPEFSVDETLRTDECLLSVSDKVQKFKTTADKLKIDDIPERPKSPRCQFTAASKPTSDRVPEGRRQSVVTEDLTNDECLLSVSQKVIKFVDTAESLRKKPEHPIAGEGPKPKKTPISAPLLDETPKSSKKVYLSSVGKLRSSESIKRAKDIFESVSDTSKTSSSVLKPKTPKDTSPSMKPYLEDVRRTLTYEDDNVPGYMKQLDRSLRITSPHRESVLELEEISKGHVSTQLHEEHNVDKEKTKFGVTLRRTDSGIKKSNIVERKEISTIDVNGTKKEVEDVYDVEILETMLETVTNYELRRRIRSQIRIVKKMISDGKITISTSKRQPSTEKNVAVTESYKVTKRITTNKNEDKVNESILKRPSVLDKAKTPEKIGFKPFRRSPDRQPETKARKDDRPEWAKERPLRKASERVTPTTKKFATTTTTTLRKEVKKDRSPSKDATDAITSCYGIGPTDENGMPLFGLKALRAHNKTKVQGQVTRSTFHSENGKEPVGEITTTKYSGDSVNGIQSKTTTQKINQRKAITNTARNVEKKNDERTKVIRRNSIKEISQKFMDNNSESSISERKNFYKAGLILRTSSFKERKSSSRESSPEVSRKQTTGGSFLTNTSKVTGMQDVITRMKTEEYVEGDSSEDVEARQMLNKFLGSQVILAGMEGGATSTSSVAKSASASSTTTGSKRTTKVTTTVTENGVPKTSTRTFTHPITQDVLNTVWNEQTLRLLLEQSTEYEERRIIRLRLKEVMAEKEACSEYMDKTLEETQSQGGNVHGESLLLPLLQNALEAPEFEQTADSGTESGEDLRSGLILEVQSALEKLSACLCSESSDISLERRNSLLQLVSKLQTNLVVAPVAGASGDAGGANQERRLSGGGGRFARRQQRQQRPARHTVGVTSEELEDARRIMEEFVLSSSQDNVPGLQEKLDEKPAYGPIKVCQGAVKNAMPKPFTNSANSSGTSSTVQTPSNESIEPELPPPLHDDEICAVPENDRYCYKQSMSFDQMPLEPKPKLMQTHSLDEQNIELLNAVQYAAGIKAFPEQAVHDSETDEDTLKPTISPYRQPNDLKDGDTVVLYDQGIYPPPPSQIQLQPSAPLHVQPVQTIQPLQSTQPVPTIQSIQPIVPIYDDEVVLQNNPIYAQDTDKSNRFNAKKSRMKRANTIDIPKPSNYYYEDPESDGDLTEPESSRRSHYLALRGPIRLGNKGNKPLSQNRVPSFEPKTESDKKFLAFINRQNSQSNVSHKTSLWDKAGHAQQSESSGGTNWTRKFGNIKTNFERNALDNQQPIVPKQPQSSARNFWKSAENQKISVSEHSKSIRQRFGGEVPTNKHVVAGSAKAAPAPKTYKFEPQPLTINKFTHNPHESAFKPIQKTPKPDVIANIKTPESRTPDAPLYLYSPKSFEGQSPEHNSAPWSHKNAFVAPHQQNGGGERRVLSLAASKFENNMPTPEEPKVAPRKLSKEKINTTLQNNILEKPNSYVPPVTNAGGVRKLSGQYNNNQTDARPEYVAQFNVKYKSAFAPVPQTRSMQPEQTHYHGHAQVQHKNPPPSHDPFLRNHNVGTPPVNYEKYADHNARNSPTTHHDDHHSPQSQHHPNSHHHHRHHHKHQAHTENVAIPASFHTTSPTVQNIQMRRGHGSEGQNHVKYASKKADTLSHAPHTVEQQHEKREHEPHVYYNNVTYQPPSQSVQQRPQYDSQTSTESVHEYVAVSSKVMSGPVSQQAVTVTNKPKSRDEHDMDAAFNLRNTLQIKSEIKAKSPVASSITIPSVVPPAPAGKPKFCVNDEPLSLDTLEVTARGESIVTGKFQIPAQHKQPHQPQRISPHLSKSDSWHQVVQNEQVARKPSPRASPNARTVMKSKSTHALALPKQFEAGMSKDEMASKKRTMEAYFGQSGQLQPTPVVQQSARVGTANAFKHRAVNRTKTTQKISTSTTEKIVTTKSFNEGPMTRTQVTTRVTQQQQIVKKPMSPFAKFRQMDRQNSLNTPPSTPKTPTGGGPMFKFTDPNLSQSASTIKERLLHWCQMKTKEYDNIKLDNFSTSWADGLAFCALVHHFLPDAFDYAKLTPNNRRYNFTLAFQVADEKADIAPLLDVDDMVATRRPDWKCVFTYVQSIYQRFKNQD